MSAHKVEVPQRVICDCTNCSGNSWMPCENALLNHIVESTRACKRQSRFLIGLSLVPMVLVIAIALLMLKGG